MIPSTGYSRKGESIGTEHRPAVIWAGGDDKNRTGVSGCDGTVLYLDDQMGSLSFTEADSKQNVFR